LNYGPFVLVQSLLILGATRKVETMKKLLLIGLLASLGLMSILGGGCSSTPTTSESAGETPQAAPEAAAQPADSGKSESPVSLGAVSSGRAS
jgi:hypothetical protein